MREHSAMRGPVDETYAEYIRTYNRNLEALSAEFPNGEFLLLQELLAIVYVPLADGGYPSIPKYSYGAIPKLYTTMDERVSDAVGVTRLQAIPALSLTGNGTLLGIVDTGIDLRHPAFRDASGRTRVRLLWDMTEESGEAPETFGFGSLYGMEEINELLFSGSNAPLPGADETGHGTFLAGMAGGSAAPEQNFAGIAPGAEFVVVKLKQAKRYLKEYYGVSEEVSCYSEADIMIGLRFVGMSALRLQRASSVLVGLGCGLGSHTGTGALSSYLDQQATFSGYAVSVAAGNEGNIGHHYQGMLSSGSTEDVELRVGTRVNGFTMELWGSVPNNYSLSIRSPSGEWQPVYAVGRNAQIPISFVFETARIYVDYVLMEENSGLPLIQLRFHAPDPGIWTFRIFSGGANGEGRFDLYLPASGLLDRETYFFRSTPEGTITEPGNAANGITAAATRLTDGQLYEENSRGNTALGIPKPDVTAPGVEILGCAPGGYTVGSGTSISAAVSAGCAALLLEWGIVQGQYPFMTGTTIRNFLIKGAKREPQVRYPNTQSGYGSLDLYQTFLSFRGDGGRL